MNDISNTMTKRIKGIFAHHSKNIPEDSSFANDDEFPSTTVNENGRAPAQSMSQAQIYDLVKAQQDTARALVELNSTISRLQSRDNSNVSRRMLRRDYGQSSRSIGAAAPGENEEEDDGELDFDRKQVRLDGLEVYAVVSAITAGTIVDVFDGYDPGDVVDFFWQGRYTEMLMSITFIGCGIVGIVCGLHCIFVFSLVTMYGRTAMGMERDDALEIFFRNTGLQRFHGFKTFVYSLYALMLQLVIIIASKVSSRPWLHFLVVAVTVSMMYHVHVDTQTVMDKAGVIFAPPSSLSQQNPLSDDDSTDDSVLASPKKIKLKTVVKSVGFVQAKEHRRGSEESDSKKVKKAKNSSSLNQSAGELAEQTVTGAPKHTLDLVAAAPKATIDLLAKSATGLADVTGVSTLFNMGKHTFTASKENKNE